MFYLELDIPLCVYEKKCKLTSIATTLLDNSSYCLKNAACFGFNFSKPSSGTGTKCITRKTKLMIIKVKSAS